MKIRRTILASLLACTMLMGSTALASETGDGLSKTLPDVSAEQQSKGRIEVGESPQELAVFEANDIANLYASFASAQAQYKVAIQQTEDGKQAIANAINGHAQNTSNQKFAATKSEKYSALATKISNIGNAATVDNSNQVIAGKVAYGKNHQYVTGSLKELTTGDIKEVGSENSSSQN